MSFLYKALLKNNQTGGEGSDMTPNGQSEVFPQPIAGHADDLAGQPGMAPFAGQIQSHSTPPAMWLALAICLLVIGLLAGYLFGQLGKDSGVPSQSSYAQSSMTKPIQTNSPAAENSSGTGGADKASLLQAEGLTGNTSTLANQSPVNQLPPNQTEQLAVSQADASQAAASQVTSSQDSGVEVAPSGTEVLADSNIQEASVDQNNAISFEVEGQPITRTLPDEVDLQAIPDELKNQFEMAVKQTESYEQQISEPEVSSGSSLMDINDLPLTDKAHLPNMVYQMHIFASQPTERWIKLNDKLLYEGDELQSGLVLREIRQNSIVWENSFSRFQQEALTDYFRN